VIHSDQPDEQKEKPLHYLPNPDAAGSKESFAKNFHTILLDLPVLYIDWSVMIICWRLTKDL
jgi:hypothetical protein